MEKLSRRRRFLAVYAAGAIGGCVLSYLRSPIPSLGASGEKTQFSLLLLLILSFSFYPISATCFALLVPFLVDILVTDVLPVDPPIIDLSADFKCLLCHVSQTERCCHIQFLCRFAL